MAVMWSELANRALTIAAKDMGPVWEELGDRMLDIAATEAPLTWEDLASNILTINIPEEVMVWELLETSQVILNVGDVRWEYLGEVLLDIAVSEEEPPPTCKIDADCPEGYVCQNGVCVKKEEKINWWLWGGLAVVAIAIVMLIIRARRGG